MQPLSATLSASFERFQTEAASDLVTLQEWMAVLRRGWHNRQAELLWCHAVASHSLGKMKTQAARSAPPLILQHATDALETSMILESAACPSSPTRRGGSLYNTRGITWYHDVKATPRMLRHPWIILSSPHSIPPAATWIWLVPTSDPVTEYEVTTLGASARDAVARIVDDQSFWSVWDARVFHARYAMEKMGWDSPTSAALGMAMMATLRNHADPEMDAALYESVTPTRDFYRWILDRLLRAVAGGSLREYERISLPRWVQSVSGCSDDDAWRVASGVMEMLEPLGAAARTWKKTLGVSLHVRSIRSLLRSKPSRPSPLKFAARPRHKDTLTQRSGDLLGIPEDDQHLGANETAGEVTAAGA